MALHTPYAVSTTEVLGGVLQSAPGSGTLAFRGLSQSKKTYWIKVPNQPQGPRILATEQIVSAVGRLIDAPVRETALIKIGADWAGYEVAPGLRLTQCVAHGSLELQSSVESQEQQHMRADDNARRWARWVALWDWCMGEDEQWLYDHSADKSMWSFDHNMWINATADWGADTCNSETAVPWSWRGDWSHIDAGELWRVADCLETVSREDLTGACYAVPVEWAVSLADLDSLVDMLYVRKLHVARRIRSCAQDQGR